MSRFALEMGAWGEPWRWGLGKSPARGSACPPRAGKGHRGSGFHPSWEATEEEGAQPHSPRPPLWHQRSRPPTATRPNPHFHPSEGQPQRAQRDPPTLRRHRGGPQLPSGGRKPSCPPGPPLPVSSEARTSRSQTPMARQRDQSHRPRSRPLHPRLERGDPLGSREEPPAHGRARSPPPLALARRLPWFPAS